MWLESFVVFLLNFLHINNVIKKKPAYASQAPTKEEKNIQLQL